jgi:pantoate--beta-alanine ligase
MTEKLQGEPLARSEYVSCADPETLEELNGPITHVLLSMAVYVGKTRLIDNIVIDSRVKK